ncbi:hypothetical protein [Paenibacillus shenyangensis]|uniref:hypothetical protein n=1 Tax=Paenibacillus sp. A9 TaxID=1284352 RepID=UPI00036BD6D6|nr:hypothetical protein [Paenibacillus sp. A9]
MKRFLLCSAPRRFHINPLRQAVQILARDGYKVRIAAPMNMEAHATLCYGLEFDAAGIDWTAGAGSVAGCRLSSGYLKDGNDGCA